MTLIQILVLFQKVLCTDFVLLCFEAFFCNWTKWHPITQSVLPLSFIQARSIFSISWLQRSTLPCDCGCRGLPCTIFQSAESSWMTQAVNSRPFSLSKMWGAPKSKNTFSNYNATSHHLLRLASLKLLNAWWPAQYLSLIHISIVNTSVRITSS